MACLTLPPPPPSDLSCDSPGDPPCTTCSSWQPDIYDIPLREYFPNLFLSSRCGDNTIIMWILCTFNQNDIVTTTGLPRVFHKYSVVYWDSIGSPE